MNNVTISNIFYANTNKGELTERTIIRLEPAENVTVIDVTGFSPDRQQHMADLYQQYQDFRTVAMKSIPSFEVWAEQQENVYLTPAWKSLKSSHIIKR